MVRLRSDWRVLVIATAMMTVGIGPNALLYSLARTALLGPLPIPDDDRVVLVRTADPRAPRAGATREEFAQWAAMPSVFDDVAWYAPRPGLLLSGATEVERLMAVVVSPGFFRFAGARLVDRPGATGVDAGAHTRRVVLSDDLWRRQFGARPSTLGSTIILDDRPYVVAAVLPRGFDFPKILYPRWDRLDAWIVDDALVSSAQRVTVLARLRTAVSPTDAVRELNGRLSPPQRARGCRAEIRALRDAVVGDVSSRLYLLLALVGLVLLLSCANVSHLLLARSRHRRREMAICLALGSTRWRVVRALALEACVVGVIAGFVGSGIASWGLAAVEPRLPIDFPRLGAAQMDFVILAVTVIVSCVGSLLCSMAPVLAIRTVNIQAVLASVSDDRRQGASVTTGFRQGLIVVEVAVSLALVSGSLLSVQNLWQQAHTPLGIRSDSVTTARIVLSGRRYQSVQARSAYYSSVVERVAAIPGVTGASIASSVPGFAAGAGDDVSLAPPAAGGPTHKVDLYLVGPDYFDVLGMAVVAGRLFLNERAAVDEVMVSRSLASYFGGPAQAVGRIIYVGEQGQPRRIVGVVTDTRALSASPDVAHSVYGPMLQSPLPSAFLIAKGPESVGAGALRAATDDVDATQPADRIVTLDQLLDRELGRHRFMAQMVGGFGLLALVLTISGVYSVISYLVVWRERELAIRACVGACPSSLVWGVVKTHFAALTTGLVLGAWLSYVLADLAMTAIVDVGPFHPGAIVAAVAVVGVLALVAIVGPTVRATNVSPTVLLTR